MSANPQARDYKPEHEEIQRQGNATGYNKGLADGKERGRKEAWDKMKVVCACQLDNGNCNAVGKRTDKCIFKYCPLMETK